MDLALDPSVQSAFITGAFAVLVAMVSISGELIRRQSKAIAQVHEHSAAAREQVQNSHSTNLRDDLDKVMEAVHAVLWNQARDEQTLRDQSAIMRDHSAQLVEVSARVDQERIERLTVAEMVGHLVGTMVKPGPKSALDTDSH